MANLDQLKDRNFRQNRHFSEDFRRKKVEEIDKCVTTIAEICREYQVTRACIYKWIYRYSLMKKKGVRTIIEAESDTVKIKALKDHISQLEQLVGQKQFQIDFLSKQMDIACQEYGIDLKKKLSGKASAGSGKTGNNTTIK